MTLFSGEWLYDEKTKRYSKAYEGEVVHHWSGGVTWRTTKVVAQALINDQATLLADLPEADRLRWDGDVFVMDCNSDGEVYTQLKDSDDMWQMPSWTWSEVKAEEADVVVRVERALTPEGLARTELMHLLEECSGGLETDERGYLQHYRNNEGERTYFDPWWNGFDHPIVWLPEAEAERLAIKAMNIITVVLSLLYPRETYTLHYTSEGPTGTWSVYSEQYENEAAVDKAAGPIDGLTILVSTHPTEQEADAEANRLQRQIAPARVPT